MTALKRIPKFVRVGILAGAAICSLTGAEHRGLVKFGGMPVPGATVTATQGDKKLVAVTDSQGVYSFADLAEGVWSMQVEMLCFAPIKQEVGVSAGAPPPQFELKMLPFEEIKASAPPPPTPSPNATAAVTQATPSPEAANVAASQPAPSIAQAAQAVAGNGKKPAAPKKGKGAAPVTTAQSGFQRTGVNASPDAAKPADSTPAPAAPPAGGDAPASGDGFLINGSQNNGAASPFATSPAFGNNRRGFRSPYQASLGFQLDNSALNARPFSITGQETPRPATNRFQGVASFGGPLYIKHIIPASRNPINFFLNYQWARSRNGTTSSSRVPTAAERSGDFSQAVTPQGQPLQIFDPTTGLPFANNIIPQNRISPQAQALLKLYPMPNFASGIYDYQVPLVSGLTSDDIQSRLSKTLSQKNQINGVFAYQRTNGHNPNLFGFQDTTDTSGINFQFNWQHRFSQRLFSRFGVAYSRATNKTTPYFANVQNISGDAGITGNNQEPINWGPPTLNFSGSGMAGLNDANYSNVRTQTAGISGDTLWTRRAHNINFGGDVKRQQFNYLSQADPRGIFTFNAASTQQTVNGAIVPNTGYDFAGFMLGLPDSSAIAYGNADKYLRGSLYDAYVTDDWRVRAGFTLNVGLRWDYATPMTELYGRLVNLDIAPGYGPISPVVANNPIGSLTHQRYADSLVNPDKHAFQPRVAIAWRPFLASSLSIRAGYGVYYDTSVYQSIATQMYQQSPLSKSLSIQSDPANPLTLASGFNAPPNVATNTFAVDPNFHVGYAQNWQISAQRDLPASLIITLTYLGIKGTRAQQFFYPNTYPTGAINPCPVCVSGYKYMTSNGNSTRNAGTVQLRRRLHNGFQASLQYTLSKALDDATLGGRGTAGLIAQNWLNLSAERGLSPFDAHHTGAVQLQYSTGVGAGGGGLMTGWRGLLFKEWTFVSSFNLSSGLPLSPIYPVGVAGTGLTGIRPNYTGAPLYDDASGRNVNPLAFAAPGIGQWGNAGRDIIIGPNQFTMSASMGRSFTVGDRHSIDVRFDSTNVLNHVTYPNWNTNILSQQFGLPSAGNQMRVVRANVRLRF